MPNSTIKQSPRRALMTNTILFGVGAGLIVYCWIWNSFYVSNETLSEGTWWVLNKNLLLATVALLLGGFFHSIIILYPETAKFENENSHSQIRDQQMQHNTYHDSLTGIHNRWFFDQSLKSYLFEFEDIGASLGLLLLDMERFNEINDKFGAGVGDLVLKKVAEKLHENVRDHDVVARVGDEQFAVITRFTNKEQLAKIAGRYKIMVDEISVSYQNTIIRPSVSIGIATNKDSTDAAELFRTANIRLYQTKLHKSKQIAA